MKEEVFFEQKNYSDCGLCSAATWKVTSFRTIVVYTHTHLQPQGRFCFFVFVLFCFVWHSCFIENNNTRVWCWVICLFLSCSSRLMYLQVRVRIFLPFCSNRLAVDAKKNLRSCGIVLLFYLILIEKDSRGQRNTHEMPKLFLFCHFGKKTRTFFFDFDLAYIIYSFTTNKNQNSLLKKKWNSGRKKRS